jgi:predicted RNA-binding protein YlxR (DUF448 family)
VTLAATSSPADTLPHTSRMAGDRRAPAPVRTCVACRTERAKGDLARLVRGADGSVAFDASGRRPGRGAYLCRDGACWQLAVKRGAIERALSVRLTDDLRRLLEEGDIGGIDGGPHGA